MHDSLLAIYTTLQRHFGTNPDWWPIFGSDAPFEILLGAVLVQQTRWENVEDAILRLRAAELLSPVALSNAAPDEVAALVRPAAFPTQKAQGIITISTYLCTHYQGNTATLLDQPSAVLRRELLELPRIGPETADVIMLYAGKHTIFVVDDYTRRLFGRVQPSSGIHLAIPFDWQHARYAQVQEHIEHALSAIAVGELLPRQSTPMTHQALYADFHALINEQCVRYCLARKPRCDGPPARRVYSIQAERESYLDRHDGCPLRAICAYYKQRDS